MAGTRPSFTAICCVDAGLTPFFLRIVLRTAVETAIAKHDFRPDAAARGLALGRTLTIGVLSQAIDSPFYAEGLRGVERRLLQAGYAPMFMSGNWNEVDEQRCMEEFVDRGVDGIIMFSGRLSDAAVKEFARRVPVVVTGRSLRAAHVFSLPIDDRLGALLAVRHLVGLGHRHIAFIAGSENHPDALDRLAGYRQGLEEAGIAFDPELVVPGDWQEPQENILRGIFDRILQILARMMPGAKSIRVALHRARGVKIGKGVWIGYDVVLDTARPDLIVIEEGVAISMRAVVIAHFKEQRGVRIEKEAFIGPGVIVLPGVIIGRGAVVKAGSVVSHSVPPMTVVQGNPALPVAKCGIPFRQDVSMRLFSRHLKPLAAPSSNPGRRPGSGGNPAGENTSTGKKV